MSGFVPTTINEIKQSLCPNGSGILAKIFNKTKKERT